MEKDISGFSTRRFFENSDGKLIDFSVNKEKKNDSLCSCADTLADNDFSTDMWWIDDSEAVKHALCYAISGNSTYVSEHLAKKKPDVLSPLAFDDGRILGLSDAALPTEDCISENPTIALRPFKIKNKFKGGAAIAAFNISDCGNAVTGTVSAMEAGLSKNKTYLYYEYFTGEFGYVNSDECIDVIIENGDSFKYYTFIEKTKNKPLFIGRIDKLNSRLAVVSQREDEIALYEGGEFAFVSDEDYAVYDELGNEIDTERYGILVSGYCSKENKRLKFVKYDS